MYLVFIPFHINLSYITTTFHVNFPFFETVLQLLFFGFFHDVCCFFLPLLERIEIRFILMRIWSWRTDKSYLMLSQVNKVDGLKLGFYTWLETTWRTMQCETVRCLDEVSMTCSSTISFFHIVFAELSKNLKVVMFINSLTFKNPVKIHNPTNIENFLLTDMEVRRERT